jgi:SAM-dependent methyltransferase
MSLSTFDEAAADYDAQLNRGLAITGEDKEYFAERRMIHLANCLEAMAFEAREVLDFGCGTGTATPYLFRYLGARAVWGLDPSDRSLAVARTRYRDYPAGFVNLASFQPRENVDLAFCNGVFHHIPPCGRGGALRRILAALRPGGLVSFWENNPWNPGTRYVMSCVPFDRGAIVISPRQAGRMLRAAGFEILGTDFLFFFPAMLRGLRGLERHLVKLPLGGQYQVLCRKPAAGTVRAPSHNRLP